MTKKWWQLDATKIETHTEPNISKTSKRHHAMHEQAPCFFFFNQHQNRLSYIQANDKY